MLSDDERFRVVYAQVVKLWAAMDNGTEADMDREQAILVTLLEERNKQRGS